MAGKSTDHIQITMRTNVRYDESDEQDRSCLAPKEVRMRDEQQVREGDRAEIVPRSSTERHVPRKGGGS